MKKCLFYLTTIAFLAACTADITTIPSSVRLNYYSATIKPGESLTLIADILPDEAAIKTITWSSTDPSIAVVSNGVVTGIAEGETFISVITNSGKKSAACKLLVAYPVSSVTLDQTLLILSIGKSQKLTATVLPEHAPDKSVKWESSNPDVAEINNEGVVIAKANGTAIITVITDVGNRITTCTVKVTSGNYTSMVWQPQYGYARFFIAGSGTVDIDWGDGSTPETLTLSASGLSYYHSYSDLIPYAVIISGSGNITHLDCSNSRLTALDVSRIVTLTRLECSNNQLTNLDLSLNTKLITLNCSSNQLTSLNVSGISTLTRLECFSNQLTNLDLRTNIALTFLNCSSNRLTNLDLSTELIELNCRINRLTSLDLSLNTKLITLDCSYNQLISLEVIDKALLKTLYCEHNIQLRNLNVRNNPVLTEIICNGNQLTSLDMSGNTALTTLNCDNNQLSAAALNNLFETLHDNPGAKWLYVTNNPGYRDPLCDISIAANKGWVLWLWW